MPPEARQKLKDKLQAIDDAVTRNELKDAIEAMLVFEKNLGKRTEAELTAIKKAVDSAIERMHTIAVNEAETVVGQAREELMAKFDEDMSKMMLEHESMMAECDAKMTGIKNGEDGMDGKDADEVDEEAIISKILPQLPKPKEPELTLRDKERLEDEIEELRKKIANTRTAPFIGPSRGVFLKVNGVKQGIVSELNIVGSGVAITNVNGLPTVTITGGSGSGVAVETPTGTVDGTNLAFTVTQIPLWIDSDGQPKYETIHYTRSGFNITFIDGNQPRDAALGGYIRNIYSA